MNGWFWRSAFGPIPSAATGVVRTNGLPGQVMTAKKKRLTDASVAPTHGISARCRSRFRHSASDAQPVARNVQNRIEPSSAAHRLIALIERRRGGRVVLGHVQDAEVVGQQARHHGRAANAGGNEGADDGAPPAQRQARVATASGEDEDDRAVGAQRQSGEDGDVPDGGDHYSSPGSKPRSEGSRAGLGSLVVLVVLHDDPGRLEDAVGPERSLDDRAAALPEGSGGRGGRVDRDLRVGDR